MSTGRFCRVPVHAAVLEGAFSACPCKANLQTWLFGFGSGLCHCCCHLWVIRGRGSLARVPVSFVALSQHHLPPNTCWESLEETARQGGTQLRTSEVDHAVPRPELGNLKAPLAKGDWKLQVMSPPAPLGFLSRSLCFGVEKKYEGGPQKAARGQSALSTFYWVVSLRKQIKIFLLPFRRLGVSNESRNCNKQTVFKNNLLQLRKGWKLIFLLFTQSQNHDKLKPAFRRESLFHSTLLDSLSVASD